MVKRTEDGGRQPDDVEVKIMSSVFHEADKSFIADVFAAISVHCDNFISFHQSSVRSFASRTQLQ